jgi:hypothetical protein
MLDAPKFNQVHSLAKKYRKHSHSMGDDHFGLQLHEIADRAFMDLVIFNDIQLSLNGQYRHQIAKMS